MATTGVVTAAVATVVTVLIGVTVIITITVMSVIAGERAGGGQRERRGQGGDRQCLADTHRPILPSGNCRINPGRGPGFRRDQRTTSRMMSKMIPVAISTSSTSGPTIMR